MGAGRTPLRITFNAQATVARMQAVLRNIVFSTSDPSSSTQPRTLRVQLFDGDGGVSSPVTKTVNFVG